MGRKTNQTMSRSNPTESTQHVATRWIEYNGEFGSFKTYNKEHINDDGSKGANIDLGPKLTFLYLDTTYTVTGWSDANSAGIYANEVKDISNGILTVKCFKGNAAPHIGNWASIKDAVKAMGGKFTANVYIAYKNGDSLEIGVLQLKGAAYAEWNEFAKKKGKALIEGAVSIASHKDGKKGSVKFKTPIFDTIPVSEKSNLAAIELDKELQGFFKAKIAEVVVAAAQAAPQQIAVTGESYEASMQAQAPKVEAPTAADMEQMYGEREPKAGAMQPDTGFDMSQDDGLPF
jgi:hypothetical protein